MYFQKLIIEVKQGPLQALLGLCVVALIMFGGSVNDVASTVLALFTLFGLSKLNRLKMSWISLDALEKLMFTAFVLYVFSGFLSYINVEDTREYIKQMDRYLRFFFLVPIALTAIYAKLDIEKYFYIGLVLSGPAYFFFAIDSILQKPGWPAGRDYHHITFGDAAMINALLMMLMLVLTPMRLRWKALIMISISCALYASVLSQARGAWIALPVGLLIVFIAVLRESRLKISHAALIAVLLILGAIVTPAGNMMKDRYTQAVNEVDMFLESGQVETSIGGRFALWDLSVQVWNASPLLGTGPGDFDDEIRAYQEKNIYKDVAVHNSVHNIYLQALVNTGLLGFILLIFALVIFPSMYFIRHINNGNSVAYYGLMTVAAYAVFGLTESWILRAPVVSIYIIYLIVLILASRKKAEQS